MKRFFKISYFRFFSLLLILHSSFLIPNCFSQWLQQTLPVNKPITGIEFVDTLRGWSCTSRGTPSDTGYILYTSNGGTNWLVQFKKYNVAFYDIEIVNNQRGYAGGFLYTSGFPVLYKTTNGGLNWDSVSININHFIDDIFFVNEDSGWTCSDLFGPDVRTTTDGGNTWIVRTNGISGATGRIFFHNYSTGWVAAQFRIYRTSDAGLNWTLRGNFAEMVLSIFFLNQNTGWIGTNNDIVYFTSNAGLNWQQQWVTPFAGAITDIYFANSQTGWGGGIHQCTSTRQPTAGLIGAISVIRPAPTECLSLMILAVGQVIMEPEKYLIQLTAVEK